MPDPRTFREPAPGTSRVTIRDVARAAKVSVSTVSHALNDTGTLSRDTRERVAATAAELGYQAHPMARGLRGGHSGVIGLSIRALDDTGTYRADGAHHFERIAGAAAVAALESAFGLMLIPYPAGPSLERVALWADGYIIEDPVSSDPLVTHLQNANIPLVTVGWDPSRKSKTAWVSTDGRRHTTEVLELLRGRGARQVTFISGTERNSWNMQSEAAYRAWARDHGVKPQLIRLPAASGSAGGQSAVATLLKNSRTPDAFYCQTGRHAAGAARALLDAGLEVPRDVLIVAGSDAEECRTSPTPITALDLRPEHLGREAVELLVSIVESRQVKRQRLIEPLLHLRASTER
ncbi:hypothetical protein ADL00_26705 [Streptomyces sp. AS58]|nr:MULTISPECIES: LacI family DNA-binding transcriptional regulator [Streptomyces]KOV57637.1 hypothetical protein ADL00_26705 [Streptomyces sp. AS58]